jgi:hypothetical protein
MMQRHYQKTAAAFTIVLVMLAFSPAHPQEGDFYLRAEAGSAFSTVRLLDARLSFGYALHSLIEVEGGLGWSAGYEADFISIHAGPRFVLGRCGHNFVASLKIMIGFNQPILPKNTGSDVENNMSGTPVFLDIALAGYEYRFSFGLTLTASLGLNVALGGGKFWDNESQEIGSPGSVEILLNGGVGYRF